MAYIICGWDVHFCGLYDMGTSVADLGDGACGYNWYLYIAWLLVLYGAFVDVTVGDIYCSQPVRHLWLELWGHFVDGMRASVQKLRGHL